MIMFEIPREITCKGGLFFLSLFLVIMLLNLPTWSKLFQHREGICLLLNASSMDGNKTSCTVPQKGFDRYQYVGICINDE